MPSGSRFFPSRAPLARNPSPKHRGILSTILWTPWVLLPILRHICAQWEGRAVSSSLQPQQGECGQVAATWQRVRECWVREFLYLLSPIQRVKTGIKLPSRVWNRHICLRFASIRAAAIILKGGGHQKTSHTTWMRHIHKVMRLLFFFSFFQQVDQKVSFPYPYFCLTTYGTDGKGACFGVPCPGHCRLRQPPEIETNRTQGQTLFRTQPGHLMCLTWFPVCQIFLDDFQISTSPSKDKDLLAGRIFKRICWRQFQERRCKTFLSLTNHSHSIQISI